MGFDFNHLAVHEKLNIFISRSIQVTIGLRRYYVVDVGGEIFAQLKSNCISLSLEEMVELSLEIP